MRVKTVFFDAANTLFYASPSRNEIWLEFLTTEGFRVQPSVLEQALSEADSLYETRLYDYHGRMEELWRLYDSIIFRKLGITDKESGLVKEVNNWFYQPKWYRLYPETHEALRGLKNHGCKLGIISGNNDDLLRQLEWLDISDYFDSITYSQEARANKPEPAIFQLALKRAGCSPHEAVHVGDKYESDVLGARKTGITPILVDRDNRHFDADCLRIRDLREVETCVMRLKSDRPSPRKVND
jgi:putative hydrolase of the HAD superfamily